AHFVIGLVGLGQRDLAGVGVETRGQGLVGVLGVGVAWVDVLDLVDQGDRGDVVDRRVQAVGVPLGRDGAVGFGVVGKIGRGVDVGGVGVGDDPGPVGLVEVAGGGAADRDFVGVGVDDGTGAGGLAEFGHQGHGLVVDAVGLGHAGHAGGGADELDGVESRRSRQRGHRRHGRAPHLVSQGVMSLRCHRVGEGLAVEVVGGPAGPSGLVAVPAAAVVAARIILASAHGVSF